MSSNHTDASQCHAFLPGYLNSGSDHLAARAWITPRPHSAIGNKAPIELIDRSVACGPH